MRTFKKNENGVVIMTEKVDGYESQRVVNSEQIKQEIDNKKESLKNVQESISSLEVDLIEVAKLEG